MVIPADLPALVAPVAWMLGTWEGWGMHANPAPGQEASAEAPADSPVIEEIRGDVVGEQMRLVTRESAGASAEASWPGAAGFACMPHPSQVPSIHATGATSAGKSSGITIMPPA